jgi:hypothetical protein
MSVKTETAPAQTGLRGGISLMGNPLPQFETCHHHLAADAQDIP